MTNILTYNPCFIEQSDQWHLMTLLQGRRHGKGLVVTFDGVCGRQEALALVGCGVGIGREQLVVHEEGEFYWHDLINSRVVNGADEFLGVVVEIMETPSNDVLVVADGDKQHLIPYVLHVYIKDVDIKHGVLRVDWRSDY